MTRPSATRGWLCGLAVVVGCHASEPASGQGQGGSSGSTGMSVEATGSSSGGGPHGASSSASTSAADGGSSSSSSGFDVIEECLEPQAIVEVTSSITPRGPMTIDEVWLGVDYCTNHPYVTFVQYPTAEVGAHEETLIVRPRAHVDTYVGVQPLALPFELEPLGTIEFLAPFDAPQAIMPSGRHLHARLEAHEQGWDMSVEVDLLDCGAWDCFCPCE